MEGLTPKMFLSATSPSVHAFAWTKGSWTLRMSNLMESLSGWEMMGWWTRMWRRPWLSLLKCWNRKWKVLASESLHPGNRRLRYIHQQRMMRTTWNSFSCMSCQKIYKALRALTDFKISWRRWTGINSISGWLVKRGEVNMKKLFSLRMATGFSWVAAQLVDMVLELLLGGHCTNVCQTWCFMHIRTGYVRYISLWKMCFFKFFRVICLHLGNLTMKLSKCMTWWSCYFQIANVLVPQQW